MREERTDQRSASYLAIKAKMTLAARAYKPPLQYRAPSWSWASVNRPVEINNAFFYAPKRGASPEMVYEAQHLERKKGPRLVSTSLSHSRGSPYLDTLKGSYIQVEGYGRPLWVAKTQLSMKAAGPKGAFVQGLVFDDDPPEELYCYLDKPRELECVEKALLVLQISKQCSGLRFVYDLLLEKMLEITDAYKRVGVVEIACYNLCRLPKKPSRGATCFRYFIHPLHRVFNGIRAADYRIKEWQKDRWEKQTVKLY
ncbi:MAG: hypothetical protein Q9218_005884 [Villophora microphyllina]